MKIPAAETAAAVNSPLMADAIERPARINVTTNIRTAPSGVLMTETIDPAPLLLFPMCLTPFYIETRDGQDPDVRATDRIRDSHGIQSNFLEL